MQLFAEIGAKRYSVQLPGHDLSIPLLFNGQQPNTYGVEFASSHAWEGYGFVGDTRKGGSCNFEKYELVPHCNGTHTECVGHITNERLSIRELLKEELIPAVIVSITPENALQGDESYDPAFQPGDIIVSASALASLLSEMDSAFFLRLSSAAFPIQKKKCSWITAKLRRRFSPGRRCSSSVKKDSGICSLIFPRLTECMTKASSQPITSSGICLQVLMKLPMENQNFIQ